MGIKSARVLATTMTLTAVLLLAAGCNAGAAGQPEVQASLQRTLAQARPPYVTADAEGRKLWQLTKQFYERRQHQPAWIDGTKPHRHVAELFAALNSAALEGSIRSSTTSHSSTEHKVASKGFLRRKGISRPSEAASRTLVDLFVLKIRLYLADGLSDLAQADQSWQIRPEKVRCHRASRGSTTNNRIEKSLRELTPENPQYQGLRKVLGEYRAQAAKRGWPAFPPLRS